MHKEMGSCCLDWGISPEMVVSRGTAGTAGTA